MGNRKYFIKMRGLTFEKARIVFNQLRTSVSGNAYDLKKLQKLTEKYQETLISLREFSNEAIRYSDIGEGTADDPVLMEEEKVILHFVEEICSFAVFLSNRLQNERTISAYRRTLEAAKVEGIEEGYISKIQSDMEKYQESTSAEIRNFLDIVENKEKILEDLLAVFRKGNSKV
ncbi:MAG: hypothetical protein ACLFQK_12025 [Fibrobacterota bacterium]